MRRVKGKKSSEMESHWQSHTTVKSGFPQPSPGNNLHLCPAWTVVSMVICRASSHGEPKRLQFCPANPLGYWNRTGPEPQKRGWWWGVRDVGDQNQREYKTRSQCHVSLQMNLISASSTILLPLGFSSQSFQEHPPPLLPRVGTEAVGLHSIKGESSCWFSVFMVHPPNICWAEHRPCWPCADVSQDL